MTVSANAFGAPVTILPARTPTRTVRRKPVSRQLRARRLMATVAAVIAAVVVTGTAEQIAAHGWKAFVFRAPGVGGTPARPAAAEAGAKPASSTPQLAAPPIATGHHETRRTRHGWSDREGQLSAVPPTAIPHRAAPHLHQGTARETRAIDDHP